MNIGKFSFPDWVRQNVMQETRDCELLYFPESGKIFYYEHGEEKTMHIGKETFEFYEKYLMEIE